MNNVKKNRTGVRLLGNRRAWTRFTMNKTQQNQPVYKNIEPRCPGTKGKRGCANCLGSNTNVGCKTCWGCTYSFDVSSNAFRGAYPSYGDFANVNLIVDNSNNPPCEWKYNAIVEGFSLDASNTTVTINIEDNKCIGVQDICGVYFYAPVGGAPGVYVGQFKNCAGIGEEISGNEMSFPSEHRFVTTAKRMGAPYRNPIAGWRRTLDCCQDPCEVQIDSSGGYSLSTGDYIAYGQSRFSYKDNNNYCAGTIVNSTGTGTVAGTTITSITVALDNCCCIPIVGGEGTISTSPQPYNIGGVVIISRETSGAAKQPTNTVYKDNYSGGQGAGLNGCGACAVDCSNNLAPRSGNSARTHRPIIRSGMQEKRPCCRDNNGKCDKTNDYAFSYRQYQNNNRCLSFERSLEKFVGRYACKDQYGNCLNKYRKSGCNGCCTCCAKIQLLLVNSASPPLANRPITQNGITGTILEVIDTAVYVTGWFIIAAVDQNSNTCDGFHVGPLVVPPSTTVLGTQLISETQNSGCVSNKSNSVTIYKPNNKKFSKQGAVTSGGRLERLKLDTIKSANSKCKKDAPRGCISVQSKFLDGGVYKYPNGKYDAGKPRFTGWMFNGHHREVKSRVYNMVRYNQQPLGIPQLTAHRLTLSQGGNGCGPKQCFPRTLNLGSNRATAAGNRARIPGSKCSVCCIVKLYGNAGGVGGFPALVPGTILYQPTIGYAGTILEQVADPTGAPGGDWGWLVMQFNGHGICKSPVVTTELPGEILSTNPSGWTPSDTGIKVATLIPIYGNGNGCSCAPCANIPDQTAQGLPVC